MLFIERGGSSDWAIYRGAEAPPTMLFIEGEGAPPTVLFIEGEGGSSDCAIYREETNSEE